MAAKHPEIRVRLDVAGDDFRVVDRVTKAMRQAGIQPEEIEKFWDEAISGEDRDSATNMRAMGDAGAGMIEFEILGEPKPMSQVTPSITSVALVFRTSR
jgi:hypothetical protein